MSLTTLKRKTDGSYHVSGGSIQYGGKGYNNRISSGRPAFRLTQSKYPHPIVKCPCLVVQPMYPLDDETYLQQLDASLLQKEICDNLSNEYLSNEYSSKKSGNCNSCNESTIVQRTPIDYEQYLKRKHTPLPHGKQHYPPMLSRNSSSSTAPNFSYLEFIQRLSCK